ncbi:hypothetical protein UFOVP1254_2 [uncultured Caudovirales phage]|uniref:Uncharacterized protein n=1 Tax=uncultured Caudovirales phage TaxID=2100421 RepID=A0A6J5RKT4_9CAUD|nr:hypothetical protein UFOVP1254_2 [uncultured Caudovirales phage]
MTTLLAGAFISLSVGHGGFVVVDCSSGLASVIVTQTGVTGATVSLGPLPIRQIFGPYPTGANVLLHNLTADLEYDYSNGGALSFSLAAEIASSALAAPNLSCLTHCLDSGFGVVAFAMSSAQLMAFDNAGKLQTCFSEEATFHGARRSANFVEASEDFTETPTGWQIGGGTSGTLVSISPHRNPVNNRFATRLTRLAGDGFNMLVLRSKVYRPGLHSFSIWLRGVDGTQAYLITLTRSPSTTVSTITVTPPAGVWTRYAVEGDVIDTTNHIVVVKPSSVGGVNQVIDVACAMMKEGATDEYVPRGVSTIPASYWTGQAGVDGVRCFNTLNPWSVASGVATRTVAETPIDPARLYGLRQGPTVTNRLYSSRDIGAAQWTMSSASAATASASDDSSTLGYRGLRKLVEAAATAAHFVYQDWRSSNPSNTEIITAQAFVKAGERSVVYIRIRQLDGSTNAIAFFNLATGVHGNVSGTRAEAHIFKPHPASDLWLVALSYPAGSGATAPRVEFGVSSSMGTSSYAGDGISGVYFGGMLFTTAEGPVAYTGDTGSASTLTRAITTISLSPINHPRIDFSWMVEQTLWWRSSIETKSAYAYVMYAYKDVRNRAGLNLRAGVNGGGWAGSEDDITSDIFDGTLARENLFDEAGASIPQGTDLWDGTNILGYSWQPMETIGWKWSVGSNVLTGETNQAMAVGGRLAVPTADSRGWMVKLLSFNPGLEVLVTLGRDRVGGVPRGGDSFFRNVSWSAKALTSEQQLKVFA